MVRSGVAGLLALLGGAAWLAQVHQSGGTGLLHGRFLAGALPAWVGVMVILGVIARQERDWRPLGLATRLTLFRGLLLCALAGFIALPPGAGVIAWLPGSLYTTAALIDLVDGYVARRRGEETPLGARLDVAMDALGLVVAPVAAIALGRLPAFYLLVGAAYYLFHGGLWLRRRQGWPVHLDRLKASRYTRMYAGYQMGFVATVLFPVVGPPGTTIAAAMFMVPTITLFTRDWLVTTGRLDASNRTYTAGLARAGQIAWQVLPLVRAAAAAGVVALIVGNRLPVGLVVVAPLLLLGVATRLVAFVAAVFLTLALAQQWSALTLATYLVMLVSLLAGGGRAALLGEERWLLTRAGERPPDHRGSVA